jgi:hypothetical protein
MKKKDILVISENQNEIRFKYVGEEKINGDKIDRCEIALQSRFPSYHIFKEYAKSDEKWIDSSELLPDNKDDNDFSIVVIVFDKEMDSMSIGWYDNYFKEWVNEGKMEMDVTHWMEIKKPK